MTSAGAEIDPLPHPVRLRSWLFWRPPCLYREVIVNLRHEREHVLRGVLTGYRGAWLTLQRASVVLAHGAATEIRGEIVIHRDAVEFLQVLP